MHNKLHMGCFNRVLSGWHNTDITPHIWIARIPFAPYICRRIGVITEERFREHRKGSFREVHYLDITRRFPYPDNVFEAAFCSHVLEHIPRQAVSHFFREVFRVLRQGAIFRVVVPSLEMAISAYSAENPDPCLDMIFENNHSSAKNIHKWMYTKQSLSKVFRAAGFTAVTPCSYRVGRMPDVEAADNRPENSIYVEGEKP